MTSIMLQSKEDQPAVTSRQSEAMKSVLLHIHDDEGLEARLQAALAIVRASGGHLACVHVTPLSTYLGFESYGGAYILADLLKQLEEQQALMRAKIEAQLTNEDVTWSYRQETSDPAFALIRNGALADLIVVGRFKSSHSAYPAVSVFGDLLKASRTPLLICSKDQQRFDPFGPAVVAWNGSFEAANALRAALPMLKQASAVHIVSVDEDKELDFPPLGASEYLSRHGVHSELSSVSRGSLTVADKLVATAQEKGAGYLVMGAYGHSRAREYLFGGVTRSVLEDCPLPLIVAR